MLASDDSSNPLVANQPEDLLSTPPAVTTLEQRLDEVNSSIDGRAKLYLLENYPSPAFDSQSERPPSEAEKRTPSANGNTHSQVVTPTPYPQEYAGGVDKLEVIIYGNFGEGHARLCSELAVLKENASSKQGNRMYPVMGATLAVQHYGHGYQRNVVQFEYVLEADGMKISLAARENKPGIVAKVEIGSLRLTRDGLEEAWNAARRLLEELQIVYSRSRVFRVDECFDMTGIHVNEFGRAIDKGEVLTRMKAEPMIKKDMKGNYQTIRVGSRKRITVQAYDKLAELESEKYQNQRHLADAKYGELLLRRWGHSPDVATRLEFQMMGSYLRQKFNGVDSVEEYIEARPALLKWLLTVFFRLVDGPVDRKNKNQGRVSLSPLWETLTGALLEWLGDMDAELERKQKLGVKADPEVHERKCRRALVTLFAMHPDYAMTHDQRIELGHRYVDFILSSRSQIDDQVKELHEDWIRHGTFDFMTGGARPPATIERGVPVAHEDVNRELLEREVDEYRQEVMFLEGGSYD